MTEGHHGSKVAWAIMFSCGGTELLYNIAHAVRGAHDTRDWFSIMLAVLYGAAAVGVLILVSHLATTRRPVWEILVLLAVIAAAMVMSAGAVAEVIRPIAGPVLCWVMPATLDTATLMAFRFIVVPDPAGHGQHWWTKTAGRKPATRPATPPAPKPATHPAAGSPKPPQAPKPAAARAAAAPAGTLTLAGAEAQRQKMREHWDAAIAAGRLPTGGDLNRVLGRKSTDALGKKWRKRWLEALPPEHAAQLSAGGAP